MKTKLVYVLTSTLDNNYIEQALLSIYTARFHNPYANIILIVDDLTNTLFVGTRAEILNYISEKIVVELPEGMTMMLRSRWLKTSVRNIIEGDFLFIDCDTIITQPLAEIDSFKIDFGAVLDSHLLLSESNRDIYKKVISNATVLDWNISKSDKYFNSGVMFVKDVPQNRFFFERWHSEWKEGVILGISIDQPSFAKVNILFNYPVCEIDGTWNSLVFTQSEFAKNGKILHFWSYRNMSYIFNKHFLNKVKLEGVKRNEFILYSILHPNNSYLPFDNSIFHYDLVDYFKMIFTIRKVAKLISIHLENDYNDYISTSGIDSYIKKLFNNHHFFLGAFILTVYKFYRVRLNKNYKYVSNTCSINNI